MGDHMPKFTESEKEALKDLIFLSCTGTPPSAKEQEFLYRMLRQNPTEYEGIHQEVKNKAHGIQ